MIWLCVVITINEDDISTSELSMKCVFGGLFFMLVPELIPSIDSGLESILGGMNFALNYGKPMNFIANLETCEFYEIIYSAQACILMLVLLIGTLKLKGVKKFFRKRKTKKRR